MKPRLRDLLKAQKEALRKASPKSRDRIRQRVMVLEKAIVIRKRPRAA